MKRRTFIAGLGSAAAWPVVARAQQGDRVRRIGVLMGGDENDPERKARLSALTQGLADLGWTDGRNVRMDLRWYGDDVTLALALARELVGLQPDIIVTSGTPVTVAVQRETRTIPIVFVSVADPVASGIVARLDRPSGNITGFAVGELSVAGKRLEMLSEIVPGLKRAAIMFNPEASANLHYVPSFETAARSLKVVPITAHVHSDEEIEAAIIALGREPGGGLVVMGDVFTVLHRAPLILAAARNNVSAVYGVSESARDGGLLAWPLAARAQQPERMRRIGVLMPAAGDDAVFQIWVGALLQGVALSDWTIGRNVRIDTRWATANAADIRRHAAELVALAPDVILAHGAGAVGALLLATRTVPIVFPVAGDPVGAGFVDSLARPGGNATGFLAFEYSMGVKWLELLKQIAPSVTQAAVLRDATQGSGTGQFAAIQAVAPLLRVEVNPVNMREAGEIERAVAAFARSPNGGLIVAAGGPALLHRDLIITLAARHKLPAVYFSRFFVAAGGLVACAS